MSSFHKSKNRLALPYLPKCTKEIIVENKLVQVHLFFIFLLRGQNSQAIPGTVRMPPKFKFTAHPIWCITRVFQTNQPSSHLEYLLISIWQKSLLFRMPSEPQISIRYHFLLHYVCISFISFTRIVTTFMPSTGLDIFLWSQLGWGNHWSFTEESEARGKATCPKSRNSGGTKTDIPNSQCSRLTPKSTICTPFIPSRGLLSARRCRALHTTGQKLPSWFSNGSTSALELWARQGPGSRDRVGRLHPIHLSAHERSAEVGCETPRRGRVPAPPRASDFRLTYGEDRSPWALAVL